MSSDFSPLLHIDWKLPGNELLALFQHYYPDVAIFTGATFEGLLDQLTHEMPEVCFEVLAPLLAREGYDLWNLDAGADDYWPMVVPTAQREAFARYWQAPQAEPHFTANRIEPPAPAPSAPKKAKGKRRKLTWLEEVHEYPGTSYVQAYNYRSGWAAITEPDDELWLCFLIDYNPWPPVEQDMLEQRGEAVSGLDLQLIDANADSTLWRRRVVQGASGSSEDRFVYERRRGDEISRFGPADMQWPPFDDPGVVVDGQIFEREELWEPDLFTRVWRITADSSEVIFETPDELTLLPIGEGRLLLMQDSGHDCWLWHGGQTRPAHPLPALGDKLRAATAYLGGDEILLFSESQRQNLEDSGYGETVLLAWRFDVLTGACSKAVLDGFGSELRQQTALLVTQPKRTITLRTFHGQLDVARGHGDWWLWNHRANTFGTHTLSWWWNQSTNEVLKLTTRDIPRIKPYICYIAAQDRYLALEDNFVARLPAFEAMVEAKGLEVLKFE